MPPYRAPFFFATKNAVTCHPKEPLTFTLHGGPGGRCAETRPHLTPILTLTLPPTLTLTLTLGHTIQAEDGTVLWLCPVCGWGQEHSKREAEPICDRCTSVEQELEALRLAAETQAGADGSLKPKGVVGSLLAGLSRQCQPEF